MRLGRKAVFSPDIETQLKDYVLILVKLFYGLTPTEAIYTSVSKRAWVALGTLSVFSLI